MTFVGEAFTAVQKDDLEKFEAFSQRNPKRGESFYRKRSSATLKKKIKKKGKHSLLQRNDVYA